MHYVVGDQGEPIVLLHGWPQTWYTWRNLSVHFNAIK